MTLWRLEILRLVRTRRAVALFGVYLFFGFTGPILARYVEDIIQRFGGGVQISLPPPQPADGITQYLSNVQQIGLLVVLIIAASALAFDSRPEVGVFLRTRVRHVGAIILPRYVVSLAAAGVAFVLGMLAAWYETVLLLGPLPAGRMLLGIGLNLLYLAFAVAVVALVTATVRSVPAAVVVSVVILVLLPAFGIIAAVRPWLPSELVGAMDALLRAEEPGAYLRAALVTVVAAAAAVGAAVSLAGRREL